MNEHRALNSESEHTTSKRLNRAPGRVGRTTSFLAGAAIIAGAMAGCAPGVAHETPDEPTETAYAGPTWQEALAAELAKRSTIGQRIEVGDRPVTEADARAWVEADKACLTSGAVKFGSEHTRLEFSASLGGTDVMREAIRKALKIDENWQTCAGDLYVANTDSFKSSRELNVDFVLRQMLNVSAEIVPTGEEQIIPVDANTIKIWERSNIVVEDSQGTQAEDQSFGTGGTLKVQPDGTLRFTGPF